MSLNKFFSKRDQNSIIIGLSLLFSAGVASADYSAAAYADGLIGSTSTPGDQLYTYTYNPGIYSSSANIAFSASPAASVSYSATASNPVGNLGLNGGGTLTYSFEVISTPLTSVPVNFSGIYSSYQASAGNVASTSITVNAVNSNDSTYSTFQSYFYGNCGNPGCLQFTTINSTYTSIQSTPYSVFGTFSGSLNLVTNSGGSVTGQVQLFAGANLSVGFGSASASSYIDPKLQIDESFAATHPGSTLTLTTGVGNEIGISPVPEPETFALMLCGLVVIGGSSQFRRSQA